MIVFAGRSSVLMVPFSIHILGFAESQGFPRQPALERIYRQTGASLLYCMLNAWYTRVDEMKDCMVTVWLPRK